VGLAVLWVVTGRLVRPIRTVTGAAQAVAGGRLDVSADVHTRDETGALAEAFNQMTAGLRRTLEAEREANEAMRRAMETQVSKERLEATVSSYLAFVEQVSSGDLRARLKVDDEGDATMRQLGQHLNTMVVRLAGMTGQIHRAAEAIGATAAEILAATTQQAASSAEQSAAVTQTSTTINEVRAIALQTARQAGRVASDSAAMLQTAQQGTYSVEETVAGMGQIRARVQGIADAILALAERTQAIGTITTTVSELADQSNLLALNAAIEAARAGEQGKSFAVVAQQVRELAERSKAATGQVREILAEIERSTSTAVAATREGTQGAEAGSQIAARTGQLIHRIATEVDAGAQANTQIAAAAQQQTSGVEQIGQALAAIQQATAQTLASTRQAERAAQDLHTLAQDLQQAVSAYRLA
jgi:methyl-accepting chemotaxis protein